jgi:hypothetical protein
MFHDQMITLFETIVGPLLLINSIGLARAASSIVRSLAASARIQERNPGP